MRLFGTEVTHGCRKPHESAANNICKIRDEFEKQDEKSYGELIHLMRWCDFEARRIFQELTDTGAAIDLYGKRIDQGTILEELSYLGSELSRIVELVKNYFPSQPTSPTSPISPFSGHAFPLSPTRRATTLSPPLPPPPHIPLIQHLKVSAIRMDTFVIVPDFLRPQ